MSEQPDQVEINEVLYLRKKLQVITYQRDEAIDEQAKFYALADQLTAQVTELMKGRESDGPETS